MTRGRLHPVAAALVLAVAAWTLMGVLAAPSRAATTGRLSFEPHAGNSATPLSVVSSGRCSDSRATNVLVRVTGPGFPSVGQNVAPNQRAEIYPIDPSSGGYTVPFQDTLQNFAAEQTPPVRLSGRYQFTLVCTQKYGRGTFGTFTGALTFGSGTHFTDGVKAAPVAAAPGRITAARSTHTARPPSPSPRATVHPTSAARTPSAQGTAPPAVHSGSAAARAKPKPTTPPRRSAGALTSDSAASSAAAVAVDPVADRAPSHDAWWLLVLAAVASTVGVLVASAARRRRLRMRDGF